MSENQLAKQDKTPVPMNSRGVQLTNFDEMARFCAGVHASRLAPKGFDSPQAVMVAVQHGLEIGLAPMQALQSIAIINGRPVLYGDAALALANGHPDCEDVIETFDAKANAATCEVKRKGRVPVVRTFSEADAKKAGLWGKSGPWSQYPSRMLQLRARSFALRDSFPDALKGIGIREEVADYHERPVRGRVVEDIHFADETPTAEEEVGQTRQSTIEDDGESEVDFFAPIEKEGK